MRKPFVFLLFAFLILLLETQVCSTADYGDASKITQAGLKYVGAVAEILSDEKVLDSVGKYAGMLSKFAGAAGPAFALVDVIISLNKGDPKHDAVMKEFGKVLNAIDGVENSIRHQTAEILEGQAKQSLFEVLNQIKANSKNLKAYLGGGSETVKNYVITMYKDGDFSSKINTALIHLYGSSSLPDRLYERSFGSFKAISKLSVDMQSLLVEAIMNYQYACRLSGFDKNRCAKDSGLLFEDGLTKVDRKFTSLINRCKNQNSLQDNLARRIDDDPAIRNRKGLDNLHFMRYLVSIIQEHYSFFEASVIVFDHNAKPWSWKSRSSFLVAKNNWYGKNILIVGRNKLWDRSKTLSQIQSSMRYTKKEDRANFNSVFFTHWQHGSTEGVFNLLKPLNIADFVTIRGYGRYIGSTSTSRQSYRRIAYGRPHYLLMIGVFRNEICLGEMCDRLPGNKVRRIYQICLHI